jgi:asparagine synthetase B (glutamine-hydrolysing)
VIARRSIADQVWVDGRPATVSARHAEDALALVSVATGHYAIHLETPEGHVLARDPLGVNKLFFTIDRGTVRSANYVHELLADGAALDRVWSVPSGHAVVIDPDAGTYALHKHHALRFDDSQTVELPVDLVERVRGRLDVVFAGIAAIADGRSIYVCMSGGMDSTGVAVMARRWLGDVTAVTFALAEEGAHRAGAGGPPDDLATARRLSADLGMPLLEVVRPGEAVLATLDDVLRYGQDWRDFNVHCGLVNEALAEAIAADADGRGGGRPLVLTGDTMNELMADYTPVVYRGTTFYDLPRLPTAKLRRFLVGGLDSGDREVGIFGHHGIDVVQPYALCADAYAGVPAGALGDPRAKQALARSVFGEAVPEYVYARPKVRAQAASEEVGGTLGLLADRGIQGPELAARFARVLGVQPAELRGFIRAGFYRFTTTYPAPQEP